MQIGRLSGGFACWRCPFCKLGIDGNIPAYNHQWSRKRHLRLAHPWAPQHLWANPKGRSPAQQRAIAVAQTARRNSALARRLRFMRETRHPGWTTFLSTWRPSKTHYLCWRCGRIARSRGRLESCACVPVRRRGGAATALRRKLIQRVRDSLLVAAAAERPRFRRHLQLLLHLERGTGKRLRGWGTCSISGESATSCRGTRRGTTSSR